MSEKKEKRKKKNPGKKETSSAAMEKTIDPKRTKRLKEKRGCSQAVQKKQGGKCKLLGAKGTER